MNSIVNIGDKCSGCSACYSVCSVQCIKMNADRDGFLYPVVDEGKCISCNACEKVCPVLNDVKTDELFKKAVAYASYTKNDEIRMNSSSGGVFTEIASWIIEQGGAVFGAAFDGDFGVEHICVENSLNLDKLRGSKYVQSRISDSYIKAKELLDSGKIVLFTGTPCQIEGLYGFLKHDYENLYTQDIICHGVPSPLLWDKYVKYREGKASAKLHRSFFRYKKYGWKKYSVKFEFDNCTEYLQTISNDLYMRSFLSNMCLRKSCYDCNFKTKIRRSDLTLADFWGVENVCPSMDDDKGTSLVVVNTEKGRKLFSGISENVVSIEVELDDAVKYNSAMIKSASRPLEREIFLEQISVANFKKITEKYCSQPLKVVIKKELYKIAKKLKLR